MNKISLQRHPPQMPRALAPSGSARAARDEPVFDWAALVPRLVHPAKVTIIEALLWIGQPLSPSELVRLLGDDRDYYRSLVSYHMEGLKKAGAVERVRTRRNRGAKETFYYFPGG